MDISQGRSIVKKRIRIIGPNDKTAQHRTKQNYACSRDIKSQQDCVSSLPVCQESRLVIVIPPYKPAKRRRQTDSGEDDTLIAVEKRSSKRARKIVASDSSNLESDSYTLISTPPSATRARTRKSKTTTRSTFTSNHHPNIPASHPCSYSGFFDLYAMDHQDLCQISRPEGCKEPQYEDLHDALRSDENIEKLTARLFLPGVPFGRKFGSTLVPALCDPISQRPYDIELTRISHVNQVFYREHEKDCFVTRYNSDVSLAGKMPGVSGKLGVASAGAEDFGVLDSSGIFNLSRVWEKTGEDGRSMEIFEGYMSLRVRYRRDYEQKGYGEGFEIGFAFWAVRTRDTG